MVLTWLLLLPLAAGAQDAGGRLVRFLEHDSYKVRLKAAIQIGKSDMTSAAPALRKALADENATVRAAAAYSLGQLGDREARPALVGLLGAERSLVFKAASKALALLDRSGGRRPRYLVAIAPPKLPVGTGAFAAERLQRKLAAKLETSPLTAAGAGEQKRIAGDKLARHLKLRGLKGVSLRPKVLELAAVEDGGNTSFSCRISVMVVELVRNRMEFAGTGEAAADVGQVGLDPATSDDILGQVLDASVEAAADEVLAYLRRRRGP